MKKKENKANLPETALLTFLERTKEGKYAKIDQNSFTYTRLKILREETYSEEDYLYSVR